MNRLATFFSHTLSVFSPYLGLATEVALWPSDPSPSQAGELRKRRLMGSNKNLCSQTNTNKKLYPAQQMYSNFTIKRKPVLRRRKMSKIRRSPSSKLPLYNEANVYGLGYTCEPAGLSSLTDSKLLMACRLWQA